MSQSVSSLKLEFIQSPNSTTGPALLETLVTCIVPPLSMYLSLNLFFFIDEAS